MSYDDIRRYLRVLLKQAEDNPQKVQIDRTVIDPRPHFVGGTFEIGGVTGGGRGARRDFTLLSRSTATGNGNQLSAAPEKDAVPPPENCLGLRHKGVAGGFRHPESKAPETVSLEGLL